MKTGLFAALLLLFALFDSQAKDPAWAGNYIDKKFLKGTAVFELTITQEGNQITVDFDAAYNDGHGCAPEANGKARTVDKDTLTFTFTDSSNNSGTGRIKRTTDGVIVSVKSTQVSDSRCVVFYSDNIPLKPAR